MPGNARFTDLGMRSQKGSTLYRVVWSAEGQTFFNDVDGVVAVTLEDGSKQAPDHQPIPVTSRPILIEYAGTK